MKEHSIWWFKKIRFIDVCFINTDIIFWQNQHKWSFWAYFRISKPTETAAIGLSSGMTFSQSGDNCPVIRCPLITQYGTLRPNIELYRFLVCKVSIMSNFKDEKRFLVNIRSWRKNTSFFQSCVFRKIKKRDRNPAL